jgi:undecaprenyl-diphosphatase
VLRKPDIFTRYRQAYVLGVCILVALMVGVSRVYLGVHWPSDILAGWAVGCAWAVGCWLVTLWLQGRGAVEEQGEAAPPLGARQV